MQTTWNNSPQKRKDGAGGEAGGYGKEAGGGCHALGGGVRCETERGVGGEQAAVTLCQEGALSAGEKEATGRWCKRLLDVGRLRCVRVFVRVFVRVRGEEEGRRGSWC
jgi:hypothetical protein